MTGVQTCALPIYAEFAVGTREIFEAISQNQNMTVVGVGVAYARAADLKIAIISARYSPATEHRAKELGIKDVYNGGLNKLHAYNDLKEKYKLSDDQIAYLGDDMVDIPVMEIVALPIAVANATPDIMKLAKHVTKVRGGDGAFREAVEWIIEKQGRTEELYKIMRARVLNS